MAAQTEFATSCLRALIVTAANGPSARHNSGKDFVSDCLRRSSTACAKRPKSAKGKYGADFANATNRMILGNSEQIQDG